MIKKRDKTKVFFVYVLLQASCEMVKYFSLLILGDTTWKKSVKWLFIAAGGQCLFKCWFHVKIEVEYSYRPFSPVKEN